MANINQNYDGQTRLKDWWKIIKQNLNLMNDQTEKHVSGEADRHKAQDVDYSGAITGQTTVKGAVEQVQTNLNAHKTAATLDHPDGSVKAAKIADEAVTDAKIGRRSITNPTDDGQLNGFLTPLLDTISTVIKALYDRVTAHISNKSNPHGVTKAQVGLGNVDNTSDANKPISTATQTALDKKVDKVTGKGLSTNDYTTAEKNKLAGIAANANNYTHPSSHPATMITQDGTHRFATDAEKTSWNNKLGTVNIKAGSNVTVTTSGNNVTISSAGGEGPGVTVVDSLTSTSTSDALSANQGRMLEANKAPKSHTSTSTIYGAGTPSSYGHVRLYNNLTTSSSGAAALDAYQGHLLKNLIDARTKRDGKVLVVGTTIAGHTAGMCDFLCDGTDDQDEIISAIDTLGTGGGVIKILNGTYSISKTVQANVPYKNIHFIGSGKDSTILKRASNNGTNMINVFYEGISFSDLCIDGNKAVHDNTSNKGLLIGYSNRYPDINLNNACSVQNCIIRDNAGIGVESSDNGAFIFNCVFENNGSVAVSGAGIVLCNYVVDNGGAGISNPVFGAIGNICLRNRAGIQISEVYPAVGYTFKIDGNTCSDNTGQGIYATGNDNIITNNICKNNGTYGIFLGGENCILGNNICYRGTGVSSDYTSSQYTIYLHASSKNNLVSSNMIPGKNVSGSGTNNTTVNNKYN